MLHLPDVTQLVGDEIVRDVVGAEENRVVERVAVEAAPLSPIVRV